MSSGPSFSESIAPSLCYLAPETLLLPGSPLVGPLCCSWWASMVPLSLASALEAQRWPPWDCHPFWMRCGLPAAFTVARVLLSSLTGQVGSWGNRQVSPASFAQVLESQLHGPEVKGRGWAVRSMKGLLGFCRARSGFRWERSELRDPLGPNSLPLEEKKNVILHKSKRVTDSSHWDHLAHEFFFLKKKIPQASPALKSLYLNFNLQIPAKLGVHSGLGGTARAGTV